MCEVRIEVARMCEFCDKHIKAEFVYHFDKDNFRNETYIRNRSRAKFSVIRSFIRHVTGTGDNSHWNCKRSKYVGKAVCFDCKRTIGYVFKGARKINPISHHKIVDTSRPISVFNDFVVIPVFPKRVEAIKYPVFSLYRKAHGESAAYCWKCARREEHESPHSYQRINVLPSMTVSGMTIPKNIVVRRGFGVTRRRNGSDTMYMKVQSVRDPITIKAVESPGFTGPIEQKKVTENWSFIVRESEKIFIRIEGKPLLKRGVKILRR